MKRRLFTILSALSLLLCAAVVVLWVRSYTGCETVSFADVSDGWTADEVVPSGTGQRERIYTAGPGDFGGIS